MEGAVGDFANPCPTPAGILATAQRFGFLKYQPPITLLREEASLLLLDWDDVDQDFEIHLEPVTEWLYLHAVLTAIMSAWSSRGKKSLAVGSSSGS